jgi:hypothetical protein
MSSSRSTCVVVCILLGTLARPAVAQEEVNLKDGGVIKGRVTEDDGTKIVVALKGEDGGSGTARLTYDQLAPSTIYRLRLVRTPRTDAKAQLELATYAFDNGQWDDARLSYFLAEAADKKEGGKLKPQLEALVERAAPVAMQMAQKDAEAGRNVSAEQRLSRLLEHLPESPQADKAREMLNAIKTKVMDEREKARKAEVEEEVREKAQEIMGPLKARYDRAQGMVRDALANTRKQSAAIQGFRDAIAEFEGLRKDLAQALQDQGPKSDFGRHYASWDKMVKNDIVNTRLNLASLYFVRSSLMDANNEVNAALALVPDSSAALAMRGRLEVASSEGGRWKW